MLAQLQVCGVSSPESILRRAAISSTVAGHTADTRLLKSMRCLAELEVWWGLAEGRERVGGCEWDNLRFALLINTRLPTARAA